MLSLIKEVTNPYNMTHEHPLLHSPTPKIHQDPQTPLWIGGNEIHYPDV